MKNITLLTDTYKFGGHFKMLPENTERVYSYFEARHGAQFPYTVFFGLQFLLKKYFEGVVVTEAMIEEGKLMAKAHLGGEEYYNEAGWRYILKKHGGKLPIRIKAVPEGMKVETGNVMMTVENTDDNCAWLTNYLETILTHVWYTSVVCTKSYYTKQIIKKYLAETCDLPEDVMFKQILPFMVHDFGYRGVSSEESAEVGGAAHLVNFYGTDTIAGIIALRDYYTNGTSFDGIGYSVPASEHSIATAQGEAGEAGYLDRMLEKYPEGIVSIVADSYNIDRFINEYVRNRKDKILARGAQDNGKLNRVVIRPDSPRFKGDTPAKQVVWILESLWDIFGGEINSKNKRVLNSAVGTIYGDGLSTDEIEAIYREVAEAGFSVQSVVVGQGGGLLQKVNRDTNRFAFKCSAQKRNGEWAYVAKKPLDVTKASKAGRMNLLRDSETGKLLTWTYLKDSDAINNADVLKTVFENGEIVKEYNLAEVRKNAGF